MENASTLYVVATPIGNLADITQRALDVLRGVDAIACEDTRHTRRLLDHYGIDKKLVAVHQHNEEAAAQMLVGMLGDGKSIALVSDAGTPGVSDPGARVVRAVQQAGYAVVPIPGCNAAVAALSASGLLDEHFLFAGFLPARIAARRAAIAKLQPIPASLVFYEAPHRIVETVADLAALLEPARELVFARELTKLFEQVVRMPLPDASAWLAADANRQRGEFVLIVSAPPPREGFDADAERVLRALTAELPTKQAAKLAAEITGLPRNVLYDKALQFKGEV